MVEPVAVARPREAPLFEAPASYPQQIFLDWTDYCNAKCFFCPRDIAGGDFVPLAKLTKLEKVLSSVKYFSMSSSIGEPLLHPELRQILEWLYRINPTVSVRVTTNGTALTAQKAAWFAGHLDWLSISLNASNGEAHMRDMFPHLAERGIDAGKRWELHLRHITEFIAALPAEDRPRVRLNMIAHRHNIEDIVDFVYVVERVGSSHATITNILVHPNTVRWPLYGVRDLYNEAIDAARDLGTRLGIRVDASRFLTSVKSAIWIPTAANPSMLPISAARASARPAVSGARKRCPRTSIPMTRVSTGIGIKTSIAVCGISAIWQVAASATSAASSTRADFTCRRN
jgi:wyosine [tRNA(Phe)-imidazoG37] synthetase (radical SAM superfamily)